MDEDKSSYNNSQGCGCLILFFIFDCILKLHYAEKTNNYKFLLWTIPIEIALFLLIFFYQ